MSRSLSNSRAHTRGGIVATIASATALLAALLVTSPVAASSSVTVHLGCPGGDANMTTLVRAVRNANLRAPKKTILYLSGGCDYAFSRARSFSRRFGPNALPVVRSHIVIHGQDATLSRSGGADQFRLMLVARSGNVSLDHLTVTGFRARDGRSGSGNVGIPGGDGRNGRDGGAIYNRGKLNLNYVTLDGNHAGNGGEGGWSTGLNAADGGAGAKGDDAITTYGGDAGAGGRGGAIFSSGTLTITNSTLSNNKAGDGSYGGDATGGNGGNGGAGSPGGNGGNGGQGRAGQGGQGGKGGAIYSSGPISISNSTLTGNASGDGGNGGDATGGNGGNGADTAGNGGDGGGSDSHAGSGGAGTAVFLHGGNAHMTDITVSDNTGGNGGSVYSHGGNGGNGGCDGSAGFGAGSSSGLGVAGTEPIASDGGATYAIFNADYVGNVDGVNGVINSGAGANGYDGTACP